MVCESVILVLVKDFNILRVNELTLTSASVQLSGLVVRVSALRLGGLGSLPGEVKPTKLQFFLAWHTASCVRLGG